jgi:hypothetical protein
MLTALEIDMKTKTHELTGAALDWAVAIAEGFKPSQLYINKWSKFSPASIYTRTFDDDGNPDGYMTGPDRLYSRKWEAGGPIIEREGLSIRYAQKDARGAWYAVQGPNRFLSPDFEGSGPTPLIAAMRCYVASKLGDTIEVPGELIGD